MKFWNLGLLKNFIGKRSDKIATTAVWNQPVAALYTMTGRYDKTQRPDLTRFGIFDQLIMPISIRDQEARPGGPGLHGSPRQKRKATTSSCLS